jgi:hypothetical protein
VNPVPKGHVTIGLSCEIENLVVARIKVHATQNTAAFHKLYVSDERGNGTPPSSYSGV